MRTKYFYASLTAAKGANSSQPSNPQNEHGLPALVLEWPPLDLDDEEPIQLPADCPAMRAAGAAITETHSWRYGPAMAAWQTAYNIAAAEAQEAASSHQAGPYHQLADLADHALAHLDEPAFAGYQKETFS